MDSVINISVELIHCPRREVTQCYGMESVTTQIFLQLFFFLHLLEEKQEVN